MVLGSFGKYMKSGGFHEIQRISWNPADFMHEIRWISWNLADFMHEIWQISWWNPADFRPWNLADFMKSGRFHEIQRISWWNPADFMHEIRRISGPEIQWMSWNPVDFMKSGRFHPWNQADFMADLEKCKLENVNFYNAYNFFFYVN